MSAVGVRAAIRPGIAATALANRRATTAMSTMVRTGTFGAGTAWMSREQVPEDAADDNAQRHPDDRPHAHRNRRLPGHRRRKLALGEPEGLQQGQVPAPPTDRGQQGEAEGDDCTGGQGATEHRRRTPDRVIVGDLRRPQHTDNAAGAVRRGGERPFDPPQGTSGQRGVRPVTDADEVGVGPGTVLSWRLRAVAGMIR